MNSSDESNDEPVLSERELEVMRLLSTGMSNAGIAAELYIGVETVKSHLSAIYRKLGVSRRGEAVAWLNEQTGPLANPDGPPAEVTTEIVDRGVRLVLVGEFDMSTVHLVTTALAAVREQSPELVELDMSRVAFIDSSGLRVLVAFRGAEPHVTVRVTDPSPSVRRVLEFSGLATVFGVEA